MDPQSSNALRIAGMSKLHEESLSASRCRVSTVSADGHQTEKA